MPNIVTFNRPRERTYTPETVASQFRLAQALAGEMDPSSIRSIPQGLNYVAQGIFSGLLDKRAREGEAALEQQNAETMAGLIDWTGLGIDPAQGRQLLALNPELAPSLVDMTLRRRQEQEATAAQQRSNEVLRGALFGSGGGAGAAPAGNPTADPNWLRAGGIPDQITQMRREGVAGIETGGEADPYRAIGPVADEQGHRAYGRYQVMDYNIGPWTQQVLGRAMTPEQFLADDAAQDRVFDTIFGRYVQQYGEEGAARAWFGGEGRVTSGGGAVDVGGMSVNRYGQTYAASLGISDRQAQLLDAMLQDPNLAPLAQQFVLERAMAGPAEPNYETFNPEHGLYDTTRGRWIVPPTPGAAAAEAPETRIMRGPDELPHLYAWNPQTGRFDIDQGIADAARAPLVNVEAEMPPAPNGFRWVNDANGQPTLERIQGVPTDAEAIVDEEFAKNHFSPWIMGGGFADTQAQVVRLQRALGALTGGQNVTGPFIGLAPDVLLNFVNPQAVNVRQQVEEVVQRSLRAILGAQFTQQEAIRLIERAYAPGLPEEINAQRVAILMDQLVAAAAVKADMVQYFQQHGTLTGWTGYLPSVDDLIAVMEQATGGGVNPPDGGGSPPAPGAYDWQGPGVPLVPRPQ